MADPSPSRPPLPQAEKQENPVATEGNTPSNNPEGEAERRANASIIREVASSCSSSSSSSCKDIQGSTRGGEESGRERLKRHRMEMAGRVWIPDIWGQEELLKDWIDCSGFDACLMPTGIVSAARKALIEEGSSGGLRIENRDGACIDQIETKSVT